MKELFEVPVIEIVLFQSNDVITTSAVELPEDNFGGNAWPF